MPRYNNERNLTPMTPIYEFMDFLLDFNMLLNIDVSLIGMWSCTTST